MGCYKIFLAAFIILIPIVLGTSVVKLNLSEMTSEADYIGKGIVEQEYSQWEENNTKIYTYTSISINKNYKGNSKKVVVRTLGGVVGDIGMKVPGQAKFSEKEEVLLFLEKEKEDVAAISKNLGLSSYEAKHTPEYDIVGFSQGKFSIKEEDGGRIVHNDESFELTLITKEGAVTGEFKAMPLEEFEKQIYWHLGYKEKRGIFSYIKEFILKLFSF